MIIIKCRDCSTTFDETSPLYIHYAENRCRKCHNKKHREYMRKRINKDIDSYFKHALQEIKRRDKDVEFDVAFLKDLHEKQGGKCIITGIDIKLGTGKGRNFNTISIDRIDNNKGYTKENVRLVCFGFNTLKHTWTDEEAYLIAKGTSNYFGEIYQ